MKCVRLKQMKKLFAVNGFEALIKKLAVLSEVTLTNDDKVNGISFISKTEQFIVGLDQALDVEAELDEKQKELEYQIGFVGKVNKKLSNERFVQNAPEAVVNNERKKLADGQARIKILEEESLLHIDESDMIHGLDHNVNSHDYVDEWYLCTINCPVSCQGHLRPN